MILAGRYEVIGELGAGGMGRLRLARSLNGGRHRSASADANSDMVVIKTALSHDGDEDERLRDEARVGMRLLHPHIVDTLDLIEVDGRPALVVAFVPGVSLHELRKKGPLPASVVCRIGAQIADALDAIHNGVDESGRSLMMLHRDVTPGNILLGDDGRARLIDLGIARSTETRASRTDSGAVRGTLRYLAPELFADGEHSPQTDLWALGVVLFEMLMGREAVRGPAATVVGRICSGRINELEIGESGDAQTLRAISWLLRPVHGERPASAREVSALFAMTQKLVEDHTDVDTQQLALACVAHAAGRVLKDNTDPAIVLARAQAQFRIEAMLQTTGVALAEMFEAGAPNAFARAQPPAPRVGPASRSGMSSRVPVRTIEEGIDIDVDVDAGSIDASDEDAAGGTGTAAETLMALEDDDPCILAEVSGTSTRAPAPPARGTLPVQPDTVVVGPPPGARHGPAGSPQFPSAPRTPGEAILMYARALQRLERDT